MQPNLPKEVWLAPLWKFQLVPTRLSSSKRLSQKPVPGIWVRKKIMAPHNSLHSQPISPIPPGFDRPSSNLDWTENQRLLAPHLPELFSFKVENPQKNRKSKSKRAVKRGRIDRSDGEECPVNIINAVDGRFQKAIILPSTFCHVRARCEKPGTRQQRQQQYGNNFCSTFLAITRARVDRFRKFKNEDTQRNVLDLANTYLSVVLFVCHFPAASLTRKERTVVGLHILYTALSRGVWF